MTYIKDPHPMYRGWFTLEEYEKELKKIPPQEKDIKMRIFLCEDPLDEMKFVNT